MGSGILTEANKANEAAGFFGTRNTLNTRKARAVSEDEVISFQWSVFSWGGAFEPGQRTETTEERGGGGARRVVKSPPEQRRGS